MVSLKRLPLFLIVICIALIAVACGGTDSPDEDTAAPPTDGDDGGDDGQDDDGQDDDGQDDSSDDEPTAEPAELQAFGFGGFSPSAIGAWDYMAVRQGFYEEEGLDVEVTEAGSSDLLRALVTERLDLAQISVGTALAAIAEGADIRAVGVSGNIGDAMFASTEITSIDQLEGQDILVGGTAGGLPHAITLAILERHGLSENDVNLQITGIADRERVTALLSGQTQFTIAGIEHMDEVDAAEDVHTLGLVKDELGGIPGTLLWVRASSLEDPEERERVMAGLRAHTRGVRFAYDNPEETVEYLLEILATDDRELAERTVETFRDITRVDPNITLDEELVSSTVAFFDHSFSVDEVAAIDVRDEVVGELGEYQLQ